MRFFLALYLGKLCAALIRLVARGRGTNLPGELALKIDPRFVAHIRGIDPEKAVFVTGTNGKSTSTNLIHHILTHAGWTVCANLGGANLLSGVATALIGDCSLGGRLRTQAVVMETDERYLKFIRQQLPAKYVCVTNIQKDQVQRNGEPSFIRSKIEEVLDGTVTLMANRDDPNVYALGDLAGRTVSYGVEANSKSYRKEDDFFAVGMPCPRCHNPLEFRCHNIENIGPFRCPVCGFGAEAGADYQVTDVDFDAGRFTANGREYPFHFSTPYFLYCYILAISVASELGLSGEQIAAALEDFSDIHGRLVTRTLAGKDLHYIKMKQENSETLQSSLNLAAEDREEKIFLLGLDEYLDFYPPLANTLCLFDCDFRGLLDSGVSKWITMSTALGRTAALRLRYDGFAEKDLIVLPDSNEATMAAALGPLPGGQAYLVEEVPFWKR